MFRLNIELNDNCIANKYKYKASAQWMLFV